MMQSDAVSQLTIMSVGRPQGSVNSALTIGMRTRLKFLTETAAKGEQSKGLARGLKICTYSN